MLGQYNERKDGQQRQLKDKGVCGGARNKMGKVESTVGKERHWKKNEGRREI